MSETKNATVNIDPDGGQITLKVAAAYAGIGNYTVYHYKDGTKINGQDPLAYGNVTNQKSILLKETAKDLIGDVLYVIILTASPVGSSEKTGAFTHLLQGKMNVVGSKLENATMSDGSGRFDFKYTIKSASGKKSAEETPSSVTPTKEEGSQ